MMVLGLGTFVVTRFGITRILSTFTPDGSAQLVPDDRIIT